MEHSTLPADILRRLPSEPMVLHPIDRTQADRLALRLHDSLPPSLDGLSTADFSAALQSSYGWRAVAEMIERAWVDGHDQSFTQKSDTVFPVQVDPSPEPATAKLTTLIPARLGERLGIASSRSRLVAHARRLGLRTTWDMEKLFIARGFRLPGENTSGTLFTESVTSAVFTDTELTALLLSPCLEMNARMICRGAFLLAAQLAVVAPESIVYEVRRARGETVVRHVAWLGCEIYPQDRRWRDLLRLLPSVRAIPAFTPGIMPDEAIRHALARL